VLVLTMTLALSCKVGGVIGERPGCEAECAAGERCDRERATCVACTDDDDCDDVPRADASDDACAPGRCISCTADSDCPDDFDCDDGRCVQPDEDDEDEEENDGQPDNSGEG
jgi:hypothetical protein